MNSVCAFLFLGAGLLLAVHPARAQETVMFENLAGSLAMTDLLFENTTGRIATPVTGTARASTSRRLTYTLPPALKRQTVQGYVARLQRTDPAAARAIDNQLGVGKYDYGQIYQGLIAGTGLRDYHAADALAAYVVLGWMIVHDVREDKHLPAGAPRALSAQLLPKLAANPKLTAAGAPAKLGEEFKLLAVVVQSGWQSAIKEGKLPAYQQGIARLFQTQYGIDLVHLQLTTRGLTKR